MQRQDAVKLVQKYNKEPFHMQHAFTVEAVMRWFANELGYGAEADFWGLAGLLHDVDFEMWPDEHCKKAPELLAEIGADEALVHAVCSHGWGECSDVEPALPQAAHVISSARAPGCWAGSWTSFWIKRWPPCAQAKGSSRLKWLRFNCVPAFHTVCRRARAAFAAWARPFYIWKGGKAAWRPNLF